jgi:hypothetical protein
MSVPIAGGPITMLASGNELFLWIAVDATNVYWTTEHTVMKLQVH